ncbi:hypothetical protein VTJ49DRAFT_6977 [Mycothermus thermophilus]|uniref:Inositol polyphosphate-related phosphatase domain-containing protein n=1 Tax=Humicola insolens TaxID=85995 RepID=A0ABR3V0U4_HUMIN
MNHHSCITNLPSTYTHCLFESYAYQISSNANSSLQEVAPLSYSFIGSYFLNPYYARFTEALNLASTWALGHGDAPTTAAASSSSPSSPDNSAAMARPSSDSPPYTLVRAKNVGMTAMLLYARDPTAVTAIAEAECGFGAADMGNKGAVGLRVTWKDGGGGGGDGTQQEKTTELTFVAAHLAAMEWNLKKRNANWRSIVAGLTFANPRDVLPPDAFPRAPADPTPDRSGAGDKAPPPRRKRQQQRLPTGDSPDPSEEEVEDDELEDETASETDGETDSAIEPLLPHGSSETAALTPSQTAALHALSIYKPTTHLFVAGDLNYRINSRTPPPGAIFPSFDPRAPAERQFDAFLPRDQLTRERKAGRTLHGLSEAEIKFGPTYKFDVLDEWPSPEDEEAEEAEEAGWTQSGEEERKPKNGVPAVPWRFAPHRWPGWCDRVLYWEVPAWAAAATPPKGKGEEEGEGVVKIDVLAYDALPLLATSDHRPVYFRARIPVLSEDEMRPPADVLVASEEADEQGGTSSAAAAAAAGGGEGNVVTTADPRLRLPLPVDVHAWERRAAARRKEVLVGWSALVWSTREGAAALGTALAVGAAGWWVWKAWL